MTNDPQARLRNQLAQREKYWNMAKNGFALFGLAWVIFFAILFASPLFSRSPEKYDPQSPKTIRAQVIELVDQDGAVRIRLAADRTGGIIAIYGPLESPRILLQSEASAAGLSMHDQTGKLRAALNRFDGPDFYGESLDLRSADGAKQLVILSSDDGASFLNLRANPDGGHAILGLDKQGQPSIRLQERDGDIWIRSPKAEAEQ